MAFITEFTCRNCNKTKIEVINGTSICQGCRSSLANKARRVHLSGLKGLTTQERLARIEETLYDLNINARLGRLEDRSVQY